MFNILLFSDNQQNQLNIKADLGKYNYRCFINNDNQLDIEEVLRLAPDLFLLDITCWGEQERKLHQRLTTEEFPASLQPGIMLLLSPQSLSCLPEFKCDDFLLYPYNPLELKIRLQRVLAGKNKLSPDETIQIKELVITPSRYEIKLAGIPLDLTYKEYELLKYLATNPGRAFTREVLLNVIWGYDYFGGTRTVDVHIRRIRAKLADDFEEYIKTIRGVGYLFQG